LRKYADDGRIEAKRVGRQRLFHVSAFEQLSAKSHIICYTRVSSHKQRDDLARQVVSMREKFPHAEIIQDIGSGLNWKRKDLQSILDRCLQGDTITLIVTHRDRLCRFGFELIEYLIAKNGGEILVLDGVKNSPQQELTEDLLTIFHVFSCRMHGLRYYSKQIEEDKNLSDEGTA
jgi:predicted site-specific integrase-resolvase